MNSQRSCNNFKLLHSKQPTGAAASTLTLQFMATFRGRRAPLPFAAVVALRWRNVRAGN